MNVSIGHPTDRPNYTVVEVGDLTLWFSYKTVIAYHYPGEGTVARQNDWGPTTGKHLGMVDVDKKDRLPGGEFETKLSRITDKLDWAVV